MTRRATLLGIALAALVSFWPTYSSQIVHSSRADFAHLSIGFLIPFVFLLGLNQLWRRRGGGLTPSELVTITCIGTIAGWMQGEGIPVFFMDMITVPTYFATPENQWREVLLHHIPDWSIVSSLEATRGYYEGLPDGRSIPWSEWMSPLFWWGTLFVVILILNICVSVIQRKQWMAHERLAFPVAAALLELTGASGSTGTVSIWLRSHRCWIGFAVVFAIYGWNATSWFYTAITPIPIVTPQDIWLADGFPPLIFNINPTTIAFGYFTKSEVLLSIWMFHLLAVLQVGLLNRFGVEMGSSDPYCSVHPAAGWQSFGGMIVFAGWGIWVARDHLKEVFRQAFGQSSSTDDTEELISFRAAVWLMIGGGTYVVLFLHGVGMDWVPLFTFSFGTIVIYLGLARIMVESGLVYIRGPITAQAFTWHLFGINGLGPSSAVAIALSYTFFCDARTLAMTGLAHIPRLGAAIAPRNRRWLVPAIFVGSGIAVSIAIGFLLHQGYHTTGSYNFGAARVGMNLWPYTANRIQATQGPDWARIQFLGIGAAFTALLYYARTLFPGFGLHPLGFTIAASSPTRRTACSIFVVWLVKKLLLKFGGLETYRRATPFFLGALLGQLIGLALGLLVDIIWFNGSGHQLNDW